MSRSGIGTTIIAIMKYFLFGALWAGLMTAVLAGCSGGDGGPGAQPTPVPTTAPTAVPMPTITPGPSPTPGTPPGVVFDLRGRTFIDNVPAAGVVVQVTGQIGAATAFEQTISGPGGGYSFFLGAGTYTVTATSGSRSVSRLVTIPAGGQTVDNFDLKL